MEIVEFLEILTTYPRQTIAIAIGFGILSAMGKLLYEYISKKIEKSIDNPDTDQINAIVHEAVSDIGKKIESIHEDFPVMNRELPPLTQSTLFPTINWLKTLLSTNISTGNKGKDLILREIGIKKLEAWEKHLFKLAQDVENCFCDCHSSKENCNKLFDVNMNAFNLAYQEYNNFWHNESYTEDEQWCLDYVIKYVNENHQENVDMTMQNIQYACESKYYDNCISRQATIFMTYGGALNKFSQEIMKSFDEINGHLTGKVFKGEII